MPPATQPTYTLTDKRAISFFATHPHIDFNAMNVLFVEIMEKLLHNLSDQIDTSQNTLLIKELTSQMATLQNQFASQNQSIQTIQDDLTAIGGKLQQDISAVMVNHLDTLLQNMRDTIKSNHSDAQKTILSHITENNELFLSKIAALTNNTEVQQFFSQELAKINQLISVETSKLSSSLEKNDTAATLSRFNEILSAKYAEIDNSFKTRFDTLLSSQSSSANSMYSEILTKLDKSSEAVEQVGTYFQKQAGSNTKGKQGEGKLEVILSQVFPSASIRNTAGMTASGDFIIERTDKNKLLIDTKDYETVVPVKEVEKIIRDIETHKCSGILVSQNSGIAQKQDFEINVHDQNVLVFIHNAQYDPSKILLAANIIDHLQPLLSHNEQEDGETVSSEMLMAINREYRELATQKLNLINTLKKNHHEMITNVQRLDLPILTKFLDSKYANTGKSGYKCEICNNFIGKNAKSLSAHQRACKKNNIVIETEQIETEN
jgi:uncharacterized coiled-coil protein SlyX